MKKTFTLAEKDNGTGISCAVDDVVTIILPWKPSSGFLWQQSGTTAGNLIEILHEGAEGKPGESVNIHFRFEIKQTGVILLSYARPWSEKEPPLKWFVAYITVVAEDVKPPLDGEIKK